MITVPINPSETQEQEDPEKIRLQRENDTLRLLIPLLGVPCVYCGLKNMAECKLGFPGCSQADDVMVGEDCNQKRMLEEKRKAEEALLEVAKNITCGACAEVIMTGAGMAGREHEPHCAHAKLKTAVGLLKRIKPATIDRNFSSVSIRKLCEDVKTFLLANPEPSVTITAGDNKVV